MMHGDVYNVKYRQTDTLYEPVLFEHLKQIRVSYTTIKVTSFIDMDHIWNHLILEKNVLGDWKKTAGGYSEKF